MLFLLELKPSLDFHSKVLHIDFAKMAKKRRLIAPSTSLAMLSEAEEESSQHIMTESSIYGDDDSDILEPLGVQRS